MSETSDLPEPMSARKKPASKPQQKQASKLLRPASGTPARPAENRWLRTIRYVWDKGGAKGGR